MSTKTRAETKRRREGKLLLELQRDHGYRLWTIKNPKDRIGTVVALPGNASLKPGTSRLVRFVRLAVPEDSALGESLIAAGRQEKPAKQGRKAR